jgi:L-lactate utilization protein LutB
MIEHEN